MLLIFASMIYGDYYPLSITVITVQSSQWDHHGTIKPEPSDSRTLYDLQTLRPGKMQKHFKMQKSVVEHRLNGQLFGT